MRAHQLFESLRADLNPHSERGRMVRSTVLTASFKIAATLLAFVASLIYARALGPHGYGLYAYVIAWTTIAGIAVSLGLPGYLVREGSRQPENIGWLVRWADRRALPIGIIAAALLTCVWFIPQAAEARELFVIAALLPLVNCLGSVRSASLSAIGYVARGQWPSQLAAPALMLAMLAGLWVTTGRLHPTELALAALASACVSTAINHWQVRKASPITELSPTPATTPSLRAALPFMWLGGLYLLNSRIDLIMLGAIRGAHDAGIYAIATRAASLITFVVTAANLSLAPRIARLYHTGDRQLLQRMITAAARRVLLATIPIAAILISAAWWLLDSFYGTAFTPAARPLQILAASELCIIAFGSVGTILNMAGQERRSMVGLIIAVILNIVLNLLLIPKMGPTGAAIATGASRVFAQALLWGWVKYHLNIRASAFGI
jgi:O-antigen/teichoic acid export membrane protein